MRLYANAALTINQRREVKRLHEQEGMSIKALAERFRVHETTIRRWSSTQVPKTTVVRPNNRDEW